MDASFLVSSALLEVMPLQHLRGAFALEPFPWRTKVNEGQKYIIVGASF
jgi:hypothetical protein